jgi:hypothetical protein
MNQYKKRVYILGGGTFSYVRNHLALAVPAFGETARRLDILCRRRFLDMDVRLKLTRMADGRSFLITMKMSLSMLQTSKRTLQPKWYSSMLVCVITLDRLERCHLTSMHLGSKQVRGSRWWNWHRPKRCSNHPRWTERYLLGGLQNHLWSDLSRAVCDRTQPVEEKFL